MGKTTTCRMVESILNAAGKTVALSTTQGMYIGGQVRRVGDSASGRYGSRLLAERDADAGVFEVARGGLITEGMLFSDYEVGAMLNVYDNHVGFRGVESRQDMAEVKKQVVVNARKMAVLNADDPLCLGVKKEIRAERICLVTVNAENAEVRDHLSNGGVGVFLEGNGENANIRLWVGRNQLFSMSAQSIPSSWDGRYRPALINAMFAVAIAYGLGIEWAAMRAGLEHFHSDETSNPGRMNFYEHLPYGLLITPVSGLRGAEELASFVSCFPVPGKKYLMFAPPAGRSDVEIEKMAQSLSKVFDAYICSDPLSILWRQAGEVANLSAKVFLESGINIDCVEVVPHHEDGLRSAFEKPSIGDLLVILSFYGWKAKELGLFTSAD